jgi:hypothetical protein
MVTVNAQLPMDCTVRIGTFNYKRSRSFPLFDPKPSDPVAFSCPAPYGDFSFALGETKPGGEIMLPVQVPGP